MGKAEEDAYYMGLALALAQKSKPSPNPQVGAVIVKNGKIIGQGFHCAPGMPHAEIEALAASTDDVTGATLYVTLEPCCHYGRTGPCCVAVHKANLGRVVVGMQDPDDNVAGQGIAALRANSHIVDVGILENKCRQMLDAYIQHRKLGRPLIHLKAAITLDGFIAAQNGDSKWITGPAARAHGHQLRAQNDGILVGIGTVLADNPTLTVRNAEGTNPTRIVLDSKLRIPLSANLIQSANEAKVILLHGPDAPIEKSNQLNQIENVETRLCAIEENGTLQLESVIEQLRSLGFLSVLIEGGSQIHGAFIQAKLADRFSLFIAPKLIGQGIPWATLPGIPAMADAINAQTNTVTQLDNDTLIQGQFRY